jgi:putative exporter of polyketide antibiotics
MSAIGGVYSIIAMFAFAIVWRGFCSLERQVNIDGLCCTTVRRLKAWLRCAAAAVCTACCCCTVQHAGSRSGGVGCAAGGVGSTQQQQQLGVQKGSVSMPQVKQQGGDALNGSDIV